MSIAQNTYEQYHTQLETEHSALERRLRQTELFSEASDFDPFAQLTLREVRATLDSIERALQRLQDGEYGLCRECGQTIADERLQVIPYVELCLGCQRKVECNARYGVRGATSHMYQTGALSCTTLS